MLVLMFQSNAARVLSVLKAVETLKGRENSKLKMASNALSLF